LFVVNFTPYFSQAFDLKYLLIEKKDKKKNGTSLPSFVPSNWSLRPKFCRRSYCISWRTTKIEKEKKRNAKCHNWVT